MPPAAKRKYDYYETSTSPTMPPSGAGPSRTYDGSNNDHLEPAVPTPELQELFNKWQQQRAMYAHLEQEAGTAPGDGNHMCDGQNDFLRPPSPTATATTMSRSPSCASTSHSVTGAINKMGLGDDKTSGKKRKQGRQGPLEAPDKARTAFIRKLKACDNCRKRKVKCYHHNLRLFEDAYHAPTATAPAAPQLTVTSSDIQTHDLIGVGENLNNIPPQLPFLTGQEDFESLLADTNPTSPNNNSPLYNFSQPRQTPANLNTTAPSYLNSFPGPQTDPGDCHVPIGRLITPDGPEYDLAEEWECRFGDDGTASSHSIASDELIICKQRYGTLPGLEEHYQSEHLHFENGKVYPRCKRCELHYDDAWWNNCPVCNMPFEDPEKWYFGDIVGGTSSRLSGRSIPVAGKDWQPPALTRNQTVTQFNVMGYGAALGGQVNSNSNIPYYPYQTGTGHGYGIDTPSRITIPPVTATQQQKGECSSAGPSTSGSIKSSCPLYAVRKELISSRRCRQPPAVVSLRLVGAPSVNPAVLRLLVLFLVTFLLTHGWLSSSSPARGAGRGRGVVAWKMSTSLSSGITAANLAEISVGCMVVGLVGMWLVRHARGRLGGADGDERRSRRQFYHRQQRCLLRDVVSFPQRSDLEGVAEFTSVLMGDNGHGGDQRGFYTHTRASAAAAG